MASLLEKRASETPDRPFLVSAGGRTSTFSEVNLEANRRADGLSELGVGPGDRVAVTLGGGLEAQVLTFALRKIGAIEVCVAPQIDDAAMSRILGATKPKALLIRAGSGRRLIDRLGTDLPALKIAVGGGGPGGDWIDYGDVAGPRTDDRPRPFGDNHPEAVLVEHAFDGSLRTYVVSHRLGATMGLTLARALGIRDDDSLYNALPTVPVESRYLTLGAALWSGCRVVVGQFTDGNFWADCRRSGVTVFSFDAAFLTSLWGEAPRSAESEHPVRLAWGAPIPTFGPLFEERFGLRLAPGYGHPGSGIVTWRDPAAKGEPYGSSGKLVPPYEIRIADRDGDPVADGIVGEILVRSRESSLIAAELPALGDTRPESGDAWFRTGDYGRLDGDRRLFVAGRRTDTARNAGGHPILNERRGLGGPFGPPST